MFYDPYDKDMQVKFHRTDPTGRTVPLADIDESCGISRNDLIITWIAFAAVGFLFGYMLGTADHSGKEPVMEQFQSWGPQEQQDFILAAISNKHSLRREIAEDWCAINKNTQRVCWNAKLNHPIRGVK